MYNSQDKDPIVKIPINMIDSIEYFPVINSLKRDEKYYQNMFEIKTKLLFKNVWDLKKKIKEENGGKTFSLSNLKN